MPTLRVHREVSAAENGFSELRRETVVCDDAGRVRAVVMRADGGRFEFFFLQQRPSLRCLRYECIGKSLP